MQESVFLPHSPHVVLVLGSTNDASGITPVSGDGAGPGTLPLSHPEPSQPVPFSKGGGCYASDCRCERSTGTHTPSLAPVYRCARLQAPVHARSPTPSALSQWPRVSTQ